MNRLIKKVYNKKVVFENYCCRIVEMNGKYYVDEIVDGEVMGRSIGLKREEVQSYLDDNCINAKFE